MWKYHLLATLTVVVWGSAFISTKVLILADFTPAQVFFFRFLLAYVGLIVIEKVQRKRIQWWCNTWQDELKMLLVALTGGSLFFYAQNTALVYTEASIVSLLICLSPLSTAFLALLFARGERPSWQLWIGAVIALLGVYIIVTSVEETTSSSDKRYWGAFLAFGASLIWSVYQLLCKPLSDKYATSMLTRKVFGYGVLTILPILWLEHPIPWSSLGNPFVIYNLLLLGLIASLACFWTWTLVIQRMGGVVSVNYLYLSPLVASILSSFLLDEVITPLMIGGGVLILGGVFLAIQPKKKKEK